MDINFNLFNLGPFHFNFGRRGDHQQQALPSKHSFSMPSSYSSDPDAVRKHELSSEHDGSPIYVRDRPMYLIGGAVVEEIVDGPGSRGIHVRFEMFHRSGQVYLRCVSLEYGIQCDGLARITDRVISDLAQGFESEKAGISKRSPEGA